VLYFHRNEGKGPEWLGPTQASQLSEYSSTPTELMGKAQNGEGLHRLAIFFDFLPMGYKAWTGKGL